MAHQNGHVCNAAQFCNPSIPRNMINLIVLLETGNSCFQRQTQLLSVVLTAVHIVEDNSHDPILLMSFVFIGRSRTLEAEMTTVCFDSGTAGELL